MKKIIMLFVLLFCSMTFGQLKADIDKPLDVTSGILRKAQSSAADALDKPSIENNKNSFLGIFNPANLTMHHSFGLSYTGFGGSDYMALGVYTNNLAYKFNDRLNFIMDASVINSPYNSFGKDFSKALNGIYITRAALNYKISNNANISVEYRMLPMGMGYGYNPYGFSSFGRYSMFNSFGNDYFWDE